MKSASFESGDRSRLESTIYLFSYVAIIVVLWSIFVDLPAQVGNARVVCTATSFFRVLA